MVGQRFVGSFIWISSEEEMTSPVITPGLVDELKVPSEFKVKDWLTASLLPSGELSSVPVIVPLADIAATPVTVSQLPDPIDKTIGSNVPKT